MVWLPGEGTAMPALFFFSYDPATLYLRQTLTILAAQTECCSYGSLIQASDGKLYGMTLRGGSSGHGIIFSYDPATFTYAKLYDFGSTNGVQPFGSLVQASDGKLYGMTHGGGSYGGGVIFSYDPATAAYAILWNLGMTGFTRSASLSPTAALYTGFRWQIIWYVFSGECRGNWNPGNFFL